jgi:methionyl aminopeptidase
MEQRAGRGVILKSDREIALMREAGRLVYEVHAELAEYVKPGVTTGQLNEIAEKRIADAGAIALFKGVVNPQARTAFPAALCTSVNDQVVHGIPGDCRLDEGDIVSVDCGVKLDGYCGDAARTLAVGKISAEAQKLLDVTEKSLALALSEIKIGRMWSEVARCLQAYVEGEGFSVVRDFVGHGIGQEMHEEPKVPNYHDRKQARSDFRLLKNMVLAIEPMVNAGSHEVQFGDPDRWAVVTRDGKLAAHFEHTVAITERGVEILTAA